MSDFVTPGRSPLPTRASQACAVAMGLLTFALEIDPRIRAEIETIVGTGSGVVKTKHDIEL